MTKTNVRKIARLIIAAERAGVPAEATADLWTINELTPEGQRRAIARWEHFAAEWPTAAA